MTTAPGRLAGIALVAGSALLWSTGGLIVRSLETTDSWTIVFWRSLTAALFLFGLVAWQHRGRTLTVFRGMGFSGLGVALCFACASISLIVALNLTTVADVLIIMSASPLVAALLGRMVLGERLTPLTILAILGTMTGVAVIVWQGVADWDAGRLLGDAFAALIAISYAVAIVITRGNPGIPMTPAVCTGVTIALIVAVPMAGSLAVPAADAPLLAAFGTLQLGLGLALFVAGARLIPAAQTALLGTLEPIFGPVWVWLFAGETPASSAMAGGTIVLASLIAHTVFGSRETVRLASERR